jgi:hypothetical protein
MNPERRPWSKWKWFAAYWAVQVPIAYVGWAMLAGDDSVRRLVLHPLESPDYLGGFFAVFGSLIICQAAFLLPVRPPSPGPDRWVSRAARCTLAGFAVGLLGAVALYAAFLCLDYAGALPAKEWFNANLDPSLSTFWIVGGIGVGTTLFLLLRSALARSARLSVAIAGLAAAGLSVGIPWVAFSVATTIFGVGLSDRAFTSATAATLLVNWAVAAPLLARFVRRRGPEDGLGRIAAWLFTGSVVEAAAVIPLDVMIRRKSNCYCAEGTLWTLTICWGIGGFALGPAVWLIPLAKRRKRWYGGRCAACGYDMRACMSAERCPECGAGWRSPQVASVAPAR